MSLISSILLSAIILNAILGLFVLLGRAKVASNYYYFVLVIFLSIWILTNFLVVFVNTQDQAWLLSTVAYVSIFGIAYAFMAFCYHFPEKTIVFPPMAARLTLLSLVLVGASIFIPGFVIESIVISPWKINTGPGVGILFLTFIVMMIAAFTLLIKKLGSPTLTQREKSQVYLVLGGTIATTILGTICNLVLPFALQNYDYVRIGPSFTLIMAVCIAIAIVRYHLFDIKVIATQTFTVVLCVSLFFRTLFTSNLQDQLINSGLLALTLVACIFLVRSVLKEVEQREALAVANDNQKNLIQIMNHQIKGYLGKARTIFAELLTNDYGVIPLTAKPLVTEGFEQSAKGVEYVQTILKGESAATGTLPYDMKPMNLQKVVENVIAQQKPAAEMQGLSFTSSIDAGEYSMTGDSTQLGEAFRNLVENAIKYNSPHGNIVVTLTQNNSVMVFSVKDSGVGVADDVKTRLFTPGGRSKFSTKFNPDSSGFGLAFVKGVIETHRGTVGYATNADGPGTNFFVKLPFV